MSELIRIICANIREVRKSKGLTQEELAEKCDLHTSYLAGVERGERNITIQTLEKIAQGLEISPVNLLKVDQLNIDDQYFNKQGKLHLLINLVNEFSEDEISKLINIVREIKQMMK
ncbi:helix-turn-helix domain-containing protein [Lysinibacillus sp. S2017]|uniref:helix-turn-helix domain-containing protein n=1 Tax=Lysinibacillus sp. S2017 TaxID=2561923 RepID=UPI0010932983|nr:helix-turn-helix transcriptional regulator [Lysinibacillus sp. S2017]TGN33108.1 XRE family transcriptional regulator [Lysinibacillus sp. S2017]